MQISDQRYHGKMVAMLCKIVKIWGHGKIWVHENLQVDIELLCMHTINKTWIHVKICDQRV